MFASAVHCEPEKAVAETTPAQEVAVESTPVEAVEEQPKVRLLRTPGFDARFPNTNQSKNCWQNYKDYFRCIEAKGEDYEPCKQFQFVYKSLCPADWVEKWDEQREAGVNVLVNAKEKKHH